MRKKEIIKQRRLAANGHASGREVSVGGGTIEQFRKASVDRSVVD